eukprot:scaffold14843_cov70-Phaeocystis_antarctica.AAC.2
MSSSSVLALARSRACTHASCPPAAARIKAYEHDGEVAVARSIHERGGTNAGSQVDTRASLQQHPHHLQLAVGSGGVQKGEGCGLTVNSFTRAERVDRPSLAQPLDHLLQLASPGRLEDLDGQRGGSAHRGLASVRWGGRRGCGRLWQRCVLSDERRHGCVACVLGPPQGGVAVAVEQLGVRLTLQQGLHARLVPFSSGRHQGGAAADVLPVGVG